MELGDGLVQLSNGAVTLQTSLADGADEVNSIDTTDKTYDMFSAPVMTNETYETAVPTNGNAMAAYMMSVGLWVSGLAFCVMLSPYHQKIGNRKAGKAWLLTLAKLWAMGLLQAVLMILCLSWSTASSPGIHGQDTDHCMPCFYRIPDTGILRQLLPRHYRRLYPAGIHGAPAERLCRYLSAGTVR